MEEERREQQTDDSILPKRSSQYDEDEKSRKAKKADKRVSDSKQKHLTNNLIKQLRQWGKKVTVVATPSSKSLNQEPNLVRFSESSYNSNIDNSATYIGCLKPELAITDTVDYLWNSIKEEQFLCPFSDTLIGLSGGNTPKQAFTALSEMLLSPNKTETESENEKEIDWSKVKIFLIDERYLPPGDTDLNQQMIRDTLLANKAIKIPEENLIFPDTSLPLHECIEKYNEDLRCVLATCNRPALVTLGLGNDGHVGSWFPPLTDHMYDLSHSLVKLVVATKQDRELPGQNRIAVSMVVIEMAKRKLFLLEGDQKVKTFKRIVSLPIADNLKKQPLLQVLKTDNVTIISSPPIISTTLPITTDDHQLNIIILGGSGDLARKKILPALFVLFCDEMLPKEFHIICYARTPNTTESYWESLKHNITYLESHTERKTESQQAIFSKISANLINEFKSRLTYVHGQYDKDDSFINLAAHMDRLNKALPNDLFAEAARLCKSFCWSTSGWNRFVTEKPYGHNLESSIELNRKLTTHLNESEIFRIDHYLGKEMVLNLIPFRFANVVFNNLMSWQYISAVRITCKETAGVEGRGNYFDKFGIICDMLQNHLIQILALIAMDWPASLDGEAVRDAKVQLLKQVKPFELANTVIGQYTKSEDESIPGYLDDSSVSSNSITPTFCTTVLYIDSDRWQGVPFILKAGKALETKVTEIRFQLKPIRKNLFDQELPQNEIVVQIQPTEAIYIKILTKCPGYSFQLKQSELDYTVASRYKIKRIPEAYERLLNDIIVGDARNFVRFDELKESWRIFTPGLKEIETQKVKPILYPAKSKGPKEAYNLIAKHGYVFYEGYEWKDISKE